MRSDRYSETNNDAAEVSTVTTETAEIVHEELQTREPKHKFGRKSKAQKTDTGQNEPDLAKMKKKDLLEIMLAQSKEIDSLRAHVAELEAQLANREFEFDKLGSIAEASLAVTDIFKEAEKAAMIYIDNIRRSYEKQSNKHSDD